MDERAFTEAQLQASDQSILSDYSSSPPEMREHVHKLNSELKTWNVDVGNLGDSDGDLPSAGADDDGLTTELEKLSKSEAFLRQELGGLKSPRYESFAEPPGREIASDDSAFFSSNASSAMVNSTASSTAFPDHVSGASEGVDVLSIGSDESESVFDFLKHPSPGATEETPNNVPIGRSRFSPVPPTLPQLPPDRIFESPFFRGPIDVLASSTASSDDDEEGEAVLFASDREDGLSQDSLDGIDSAPGETTVSQETLIMGNKSPIPHMVGEFQESDAGFPTTDATVSQHKEITPVSSNQALVGTLSGGIFDNAETDKVDNIPSTPFVPGFLQPLHNNIMQSEKQKRFIREMEATREVSDGAMLYQLEAQQSIDTDSSSAFESLSAYDAATCGESSLRTSVPSSSRNPIPSSGRDISVTWSRSPPETAPETNDDKRITSIFCCGHCKTLPIVLLVLLITALVAIPSSLVIKERQASESSSFQTFQTTTPSVAPLIGAIPTTLPTEIDPVESKAPTAQPSPTNPISREEKVRNMLQASCSGPILFNNTDSAQYRALRWLVFNNSHFEEYSDERILQRFSLASLFYGTFGSRWKENSGWLSDEDECEWFSIAANPCNRETHLMRRLVLPENGIAGPLPKDLCLLRFVEEIRLFSNEITSLPSELFELPKLGILDGK